MARRIVAQGTPADMAGLAKIIEEGIRFPGFAFINVQSPCVTYGQEEQQLKAHKTNMQSLESLGHDPSDRARATELAREYGTKLYTGVLVSQPQSADDLRPGRDRTPGSAEEQAGPAARDSQPVQADQLNWVI